MKWIDCPECKREATVRVYEDNEFVKRIKRVTGKDPVPECRVCGYMEKIKKEEKA